MNNTAKLSTRQDGIDMSISKISRMVGVLLILSLIVPILNWTLVQSNFISIEDNLRITQNILANEILFRFNIINQIFSVLIILFLAVFLYVMLKSENSKLSLLGLTFRTIEAIIFLFIALLHLILLLALKEQNLDSLNQSGIRIITKLILEEHIQLTFIPGIFFGLGMLIYAYLLLKSKLISKKLATFGILSYLLICIYDTTGVLFPEYTEILIIQIICTIPMCIFHFYAGIFFIFKGVRLDKQLY